MQQEFYYFFIKKCPKLKYLNTKSIKHQIFYFPEAKTCLGSLCELEFDTSIDSTYFYGLSRFCQRIQKLVIINKDTKLNHGVVKLIEVQKSLKHFEWKDCFYGEYFAKDDPYEQILIVLEKKAGSLNYLRLSFQYVLNYEHTLLLEILPKFYKLKILIIDHYLRLNKEQLEQSEKLEKQPELEILNVERNRLNTVSNIIKNSGGRLKKILFKPYSTSDFETADENFNESSLNFIHHLKYGEELLKILIRSAPTNFKEIICDSEFKFSLKMMEEFLVNWKDRRALTIFTVIDPSSIIEEDFTELINKHKSNG
ncbi:3227_t:CDS:2, partial [Rhizophagus irregularis]